MVFAKTLSEDTAEVRQVQQGGKAVCYGRSSRRFSGFLNVSWGLKCQYRSYGPLCWQEQNNSDP
jgi:hypothetical protein